MRCAERHAGFGHPPARRGTSDNGAAPLNVAALFAGIGGIEVGLHRSGHRTIFYCENDPAAMAVLRDQFPEAEFHDDVRTLDALPQEADLLTAGFLCQDLSQAGRTKRISGRKSGVIAARLSGRCRSAPAEAAHPSPAVLVAPVRRRRR